MGKGIMYIEGARRVKRGKRRFLAGVCVVTAAALMLPGVASADKRDDLSKQKEESSQAMRDLETDLSTVSADLRDAYTTLADTRAKIPDAESAVATAEFELAESQRKAQATAALLEAAQQELADIQGNIETSDNLSQEAEDSLGELARSAYRGETLPSVVEMLVSSTSAQDFMDAYSANEALTRNQTTTLAYYEQQSGKERNREARQSAVEDRVEELKKEADDLVVEQQEKQDAAEQKRDELLALETTISEKSAFLESRKGEVQADLDAEKAEYDRLAAEIAKIDEENRKAAAAAAAANQVYTAPGASGFRSPLNIGLNITSSYGYRVHPITGKYTFHYGVDFGVSCGVPQYAAASGTVTSAGWDNIGGNTLVINHGYFDGASWKTRYMHASKLAVSVGQKVQQGQLIAYTGTTGWSTGCHLHFEVWKNGSTINPMSVL